MPDDRRAPAAALDLRELLATLDRHAVDYTVIGGVAVQAGDPRTCATSPC